MRSMPLDALALFGCVLRRRTNLRQLPRFCAVHVGPDFRSVRSALSRRRRRRHQGAVDRVADSRTQIVEPILGMIPMHDAGR